MKIVVDGVTILIMLGVTYALMAEGLWGAALMFFNILFAALIAFNFYEPCASLLAQNVSQMAQFADTLCLLLIFGVVLTGLRITTDQIAPMMVRFPNILYQIGRVVFALGGAAILIAIIILGFETAPVHKKVLTAWDYNAKAPGGLGLDRRWLSFFQYESGQIFTRQLSEPIDMFKEYGNARVFDPEGRWLINYQERRPYGEGDVLSGGGGGGGEAAGGGEESGGQASSGDGPRIPGGTAGAAVGLAPGNP